MPRKTSPPSNSSTSVKRKRRRRVKPEGAALLKEHRHEYEAILAAQGGVCAICGRPPSVRRKLDMDHDHKTMHVRGLLCVPCNRALTYRLTPEWLRAALAYVTRGPLWWRSE